jgi:beta-galactosidase/beta-glucuronidase
MKKIIGCIVILCGLMNIPCFSQEKEVKIQQTEAGGYTFLVNGEPFLAKGIIYNPTPIGKGYDYEFPSDSNKPWLIDGKLMKEVGINCVRLYSAGSDLEKTKEFIRTMYEDFGIYTVISDWLGLWSYPAANYANPDFQEKTKERILDMVQSLKNEEGLLMWILGNENNYTFSGEIGFWTSPEIEAIKEPAKKIQKKAQVYYSFVNDLASQIKEIDPNHPVALGNGETNHLDIAAKLCSDIDVLAIIIYRGKTFSNLFNNIKRIFNRPVFLSEFGCDSYNAYIGQESQTVQGEFLLSQWKEVYDNSTFSKDDGNCLGGVVFEWTDEWWKHKEGYIPNWSVHDTEGGWSQGSYFFDIRVKDNLNMNEEWFGIVSLSSEEENGINKRIPKKSFYILKDFFASLNNN